MLFHIVSFQSCLLQFIAGFFFLSYSDSSDSINYLYMYLGGDISVCLQETVQFGRPLQMLQHQYHLLLLEWILLGMIIILLLFFYF